MRSDQAVIISIEERREFTRRQNQRNKALFFALLGLSITLYIITLIHL